MTSKNPPNDIKREIDRLFLKYQRTRAQAAREMAQITASIDRLLDSLHTINDDMSVGPADSPRSSPRLSARSILSKKVKKSKSQSVSGLYKQAKSGKPPESMENKDDEDEKEVEPTTSQEVKHIKALVKKSRGVKVKVKHRPPLEETDSGAEDPAPQKTESHLVKANSMLVRKVVKSPRTMRSKSREKSPSKRGFSQSNLAAMKSMKNMIRKDQSTYDWKDSTDPKKVNPKRIVKRA